MSRRHKLSKKASRRSFRKGAMRVNPKNTRGKVMRGGIRL